MQLQQIRYARILIATLGTAGLVLGTAGCTGSDSPDTTSTTGVTQAAGPSRLPSSSGTGTGTAAPAQSNAPAKPATYKHVTKAQGTRLSDKIGGLPGVASTAYYPDLHRFEVYFHKSASKLDHNVVDSLVQQIMTKKSDQGGN